MYIDKLDDIVNKRNKTYHSTIKIKPVDVKSSTYIESNIENDKAISKFEVGDHARISKYKNIFAKDYIPNCSEKVFVIKRVKNTVPWTCVVSGINDEEIASQKRIAKKIRKGLELKN